VGPHSKPQAVAEINHCIIDFDKFSRKCLDLLLVDVFARIGGIGIIVCKKLPKTIIKLQDFTAGSSVFLYKFYVRLGKPRFQLLWVIVNRAVSTDVI